MTPQFPEGFFQYTPAPTGMSTFQQYTWAPYIVIEWNNPAGVPTTFVVERSQDGGSYFEIARYFIASPGSTNDYGDGGAQYYDDSTANTWQYRVKRIVRGVNSYYTYSAPTRSYRYLPANGPFADQSPVRLSDTSDVALVDLPGSMGFNSVRPSPYIGRKFYFDNSYQTLDVTTMDWGLFILGYQLDFGSYQEALFASGQNGQTGGHGSTDGAGATGGGGGGSDGSGGTGETGGNGGQFGVLGSMGKDSWGQDGQGSLGMLGGIGGAGLWMDSFYAFPNGGDGGNCSASSGGIPLPGVSGGGAGGSMGAGSSYASGGCGGGGGGTMVFVLNYFTNSGGETTNTFISANGGNGGDPNFPVAEPGSGGGGGVIYIVTKAYTGWYGGGSTPSNLVYFGGVAGTNIGYGSAQSGRDGFAGIYELSADEATLTLRSWSDSWDNNV